MYYVYISIKCSVLFISKFSILQGAFYISHVWVSTIDVLGTINLRSYQIGWEVLLIYSWFAIKNWRHFREKILLITGNWICDLVELHVRIAHSVTVDGGRRFYFNIDLTFFSYHIRTYKLKIIFKMLKDVKKYLMHLSLQYCVLETHLQLGKRVKKIQK